MEGIFQDALSVLSTPRSTWDEINAIVNLSLNRASYSFGSCGGKLALFL